MSMDADYVRFYQSVVRIPDDCEPPSSWLPIYNRRTPYNEDEIVYLITEIIRAFVRLSYVEQDEVIWAPEHGHDINEKLCDELNVSQTARSLMRRLPCPRKDAASSILLFESSRLFLILEDFDLRWSRESISDTEPELILPQDVQLAAGDAEASRIFLDTHENTIRVAPIGESPEVMNPPNTALERPGDSEYYRNYWPRHAPTWLRVQLNKIKSLDTIPPGLWEYSGSYVDFEEEWLRRKIKHVLEGTYGWPDDFDQAAWDNDREKVWEDANREWKALGEPEVLRFP